MRQPITNRVLLVGWAAADWQLLSPLLDQGAMPALSSLIEVGVSGNLAPVQPLVGPMLWTSLATGKRADKHGICSMLEPLPNDSGYRPVTNTGRKCQAIWNLLSAADVRSHIIGWPVTYPAEPINGSIISDRFFLHRDSAGSLNQGTVGHNLCYPQAIADDLVSLQDGRSDLPAQSLVELETDPADSARDASYDHESLASFVAALSSVHAVACRQLSDEPWDFAAVWYPTPASWDAGAQAPVMVPHSGIVTRNRGSLARKSAWKFQDELLSSLLESVGADTTVFLVSPLATEDISFGYGNTPTILNTAGPRFGIACLSGPGIRRGEVLRGGTVLDIVPTVLSLLGLPVGEDMDGRPWLEAASDNISIRHTPTWELIAGSVDSSAEKRPTLPSAAPLAASTETDSEDRQMVRLIRRNQKINLALALSDSNRADQAIDYWKELTADYPEDPYFPLQLISSLINIQDYSECRKIILQLTPEWSEHPQARLALAEVELIDGRLDEARCIVRELVDSEFALPEWLNRAGNILLKCQAWEEAEQAFLKSLQLNIDNPAAYHGLSEAYWEQDRYEEAIRESRRALKSVPSFSQARFMLAKCLQGIGNDQEAIDAFEICLGAGYQLEETHGRLASLYRIRDPIRANHHQLQSGVC